MASSYEIGGYGWRTATPPDFAAMRRAKGNSRLWGCLLTGAWLSLATGCGLAAFPQRTQLPPLGYCSVYVRDATSHELLTNSTVRFEAEKIKNWAKLELPLRASREISASRSQPSLVILPQAQSCTGHFTFQPIHKTEWTHVYFPLGAPLGGVMYHYYDGSLLAECPGHDSVRVRGAVELMAAGYKNFAPDLIEYDGKLTIFLPPQVP